jgi:hypothetical protein
MSPLCFFLQCSAVCKKYRVCLLSVLKSVYLCFDLKKFFDVI